MATAGLDGRTGKAARPLNGVASDASGSREKPTSAGARTRNTQVYVGQGFSLFSGEIA